MPASESHWGTRVAGHQSQFYVLCGQRAQLKLSGNGESKAAEETRDPVLMMRTTMHDALTHSADGGDFAVSGLVNGVAVCCPAIEVDNVGRLAFPLCAEQASALAAQGEPAPFGKDGLTLTDGAVRRALQYDGTRVRISPASWRAPLLAAVAEARIALGVPASVQIDVRLDKLLLYEVGGHFKCHKDTERGPGMFGTLLVVLPSFHEGGELSVDHDGARHVFCSGGPQSADRLLYIAFYADCDHELSPVTRGRRLVLSYSMYAVHQQHGAAHVAAGQQPTGLSADAVHSVAAERTLLACLREWAALQDAAARAKVAAAHGAPLDSGITAAPAKLALRLSHAYTDTNLSFTQLKGRDRAAVSMLRAVGGKDLIVYLVTLEKVVRGQAASGYGRNHGGMAEVSRTDYAARWVDVNGLVVRKPWKRLRNSEMLGDGAVFGKRPDHESYAGYQVSKGRGCRLLRLHTIFGVRPPPHCAFCVRDTTPDRLHTPTEPQPWSSGSLTYPFRFCERRARSVFAGQPLS